MRLENSMSERSEFAIFSIFSQSEICFLENLNSCERLFYHYLLLHYYKHFVLMFFLTPSIKYLHCHMCCNAVQSSAWLLHYIKPFMVFSLNFLYFQAKVDGVDWFSLFQFFHFIQHNYNIFILF